MSNVRKTLGVDDEWYDIMFLMGGGKCWICRRDEAVDGRMFAVDHDHVTGAVRGLLCTSCNRRLGATRNPLWLLRAAAYLIIASNAFGDCCEQCGQVAPKRLMNVSRGAARYEHRCCGKRWEVDYRTDGIPFAWNLGANPSPPGSETAKATDFDDIGRKAGAILIRFLSRFRSAWS